MTMTTVFFVILMIAFALAISCALGVSSYGSYSSYSFTDEEFAEAWFDAFEKDKYEESGVEANE